MLVCKERQKGGRSVPTGVDRVFRNGMAHPSCPCRAPGVRSPSGSSGLMAASRRVFVGSCAPPVRRASVGRADAGVRFTRGRRHRGGVPGPSVTSTAPAPPAAATSFTPAPQSAPTAAPVPPSAPPSPALHRRKHPAVAPPPPTPPPQTVTPPSKPSPPIPETELALPLPPVPPRLAPPQPRPSPRHSEIDRPLPFSTGPPRPPLRWPHGAVGTGVLCRIYWAAFRVSTASRRDAGGSPPRLS